MTVQSPTSPSTRRLSDVARHVVIPEGIASTGWGAIEAKCNEFDGKRFDPWQQGLGRVAFGKRADGKYAATVGGVALSIPRQVAKTFFIGRAVFALAILSPGLTVLWTAHRARLSDETFRKLKGLARTKGVAPHVLTVRSANGQQEIEFRNGSRILFGAREHGFGLGFDEVDVIVFDEAQRLSAKALEDMIPAANQSRQPAGALVFYMGTPPRPDDAGEAFTEIRGEALAAKRKVGGPDFGPPVESGDTLFVECSADANVGTPGGPSLDNPDQWRKANPSYPHRTPHESMLRMRKNLPSDDSWRREALGIWDSNETGWAVISEAVWTSRKGELTAPSRPVVVAVETSFDRSSSSLVAVGTGNENRAQAKVLRTAPGTAWVAAQVVQILRDHPEVSAIVIDDKAPAGALVDAIRTSLIDAVLDVDIILTNSSDMAQACAQIIDALADGTLLHGGDPALTTAVRSAIQAPMGDAWKFSRTKGGAAVTPLVAMTLAHWYWRQLMDAPSPMSQIF